MAVLLEPLFHLNENLCKANRIIIYGSGVAAKNIFTKMLQRNIKIECFADSNPDNCGKKIMNHPVFQIKNLLDMCEDSAIIVGGLYMSEVALELEKLGFKNIFFDYTNELGFVHLERDEC